MIYLAILLILIILGILFKVTSSLYFFTAGLLLVLHPLLLSKGEVIGTEILSIIAVLLILSGLLLMSISRLFIGKKWFHESINKPLIVELIFNRVLISLIILVVIFYLPFDTPLIIALFILILGAVFKINIKIIVITAIIFILLCPIFLVIEDGKYAQQIAIWAFYFLTISITLVIFNCCRNNQKIGNKSDVV